MVKTYTVNKVILTISIIFMYIVVIGGYIWLIVPIKNSNSYMKGRMFGPGLAALILITINIPKILKDKILIEDDKIKIINRDDIISEIDLAKIVCIEYYHLPLIKGFEFIRIYETNKQPRIMDFGIKNYLEIYKYIVENAKNNRDVIINKALIKRVENVKYK